MEDVIDLERICVRLDRAVCVVPGPIDPKVVSKLQENVYEQAPVYDTTDRSYYGLVETTYLRQLLDSGQPLRSDDPVIRNEGLEFYVGSFATIFDLFQKMVAQRAVIVMHESDVTEHGPCRFIYGLFTISDLNRHAVRSAIYHLLADVEAGLAKWLESFVTDPWDWLKHLDEEQQARVLGFWELSKKQKVDMGPYVALTLSQLLNVIPKLPNAMKELGYESRSQFDSAKGSLPSLRNCVMHPVRPLVLTHASVSKIYESLLTLERLREKLKSIGEKNP